MNRVMTLLKYAAAVAVLSASVSAGLVAMDLSLTPSGGATGAPSLLTRSAAPSDPGAISKGGAATRAEPSIRVASKAPIVAGPSRSECLTPPTVNGRFGLSYLQSLISSFDAVTHTSVTCVSAYLVGAQTWSQWEDPWVTNSMYGYTSWVGERPQSRQLVLQLNLIPDSLENINDPLGWEQSCAAGDFNAYATELGTSLVGAGLESSVLRLGAEMNGVWEADFIGTTKAEQNLWAMCFANEVTGLRQAAGEHFLIDWNVNACVGNYPYANYYPGNAFVDIVGLDLYDVGCETPTTSLTFTQLAREQLGLNTFEAFATAKGKPMSLPEWGLSTIPSGDDPAFINGMGSTFARRDFAFETYFEGTGKNVKAMPLGARTPRSLIAFRRWFGSGPK